MGRVGATQVLVYIVEPSVVLTLVDELFVAILFLGGHETADKFPREPPVTAGRAFREPRDELLRVVIVEVTETYQRVRCKFTRLTRVDRLRLVENLVGN